MTILIKNARIIDPANKVDETGSVYIKNGLIAAVGECGQAAADTVIDAGGLYAFPGLCDMHVHLRDPGQTQKEDIFTGCEAAVSGGVTSLVAMPNTVPAVDSAATLRAILERAKGAAARVYQTASISCALGGKNPTDLAALKSAGAIGFSDDGRPVENSRMMMSAMAAADELMVPVLSHCEDLSLAGHGIINEGEVSRKLRVVGIPAAAEDADTARVIALSASSGYPVHICHVSTAVSLNMVRAAKKDGVKVTCETAPHYFTFTEKDVEFRDADFRMNPPLRTLSDQEAVLKALRDGTIDAIATDHAPHTADDKADFHKAPNGVVGMQTSLAAAHTALCRTGIISVGKLIELMSVNPAKIMRIEAGTLSVGAPADVALFDPSENWTVVKEELKGKSHNTPFKSMTLSGRVKYTICRGEIVYKDDRQKVFGG